MVFVFVVLRLRCLRDDLGTGEGLCVFGWGEEDLRGLGVESWSSPETSCDGLHGASIPPFGYGPGLLVLDPKDDFRGDSGIPKR